VTFATMIEADEPDVHAVRRAGGRRRHLPAEGGASPNTARADLEAYARTVG
jgi:hypothetical protein